MKNYLVFGDSNTWGYIPASDRERYPFEQRICGILQKTLGPEVRIIEEALNGRMTHRDDPLNADKNAIKQLPFILDTHRPLDLVSIMLGINDMKHYMGLQAIDSAMGINTLIEIIRSANCGPDRGVPEILIIAPPVYVNADKPFGRSFVDASDKSKHFATAYQEIADKQGVHFFNAAPLAAPPADGDGVHIDAPGCAAIANALADFIQKETLLA
ncbi:MAG: GDSL-type esterase/lipase family protein [Verrucomicrobiota bacterium]